MPRKTLHFFIVAAALVYALFFNARYTENSSVLYGDALGYYMYLPSTFIYHNLKAMEKLPEDKGIPSSVLRYAGEMGEGFRTPKGYVVDQYTCGVAIMELPFFAIAHIYEKARGLPANGFSVTYNAMMRVSTAFFALLGMLLTFMIARRYFNTLHSLLSVTLIFVATNLFWFSIVQPGMSHTILFFLYALLMYLTILVHKKPSTLLLTTVGLLVGFITMIRPVDALCCIIPICYNVYNRATLVAKWQLIKENKGGLVLAVVAAIIPFIPQFAYWKMISGSFLFYSYGNQGFNWSHPKIIEGLFHFSNGWLPYAPIMVFALLGILLYKYYKAWIVTIVLLLPLYIYVIYSWYCYNYINGLGSRPMLHIYPLLALPLAAFIQYISAKGRMMKFVFTAVSLLFIWSNYAYSMLKTKMLLNSESANMRYCLSMLFKTKLNYADMVCFDVNEWQPDVKNIKKVINLGCQGFDDSFSTHSVKDWILGTTHHYRISEDEEYLPRGIHVKYSKQLFGDAKWFRCSGNFSIPYWPVYRYHLLTLAVKHSDKFISWQGILIDNKIGIADTASNKTLSTYRLDHYEQDKWGFVYGFIKIPSDIQEGDEVILEVWNANKQAMYVDDLCLDLYK